MKPRMILKAVALLSLILLVSGCARLPGEAEWQVMQHFSAEERPRLISMAQVELTPEEATAGTEELWCVNVAYVCWSCDYQGFLTCSSPWFIRKTSGGWEAVGLTSSDEQELWETLGCPIEDSVVSMGAAGIQ